MGAKPLILRTLEVANNRACRDHPTRHARISLTRARAFDSTRCAIIAPLHIGARTTRAGAPFPRESTVRDSIVQFREVVKNFAKTPVLRGVNLSIERGEFIGLAGVNGAGKTTLLKCMLDFCAIDSGHIELFGMPHTEAHSRAGLVFLPERFVPPYFLTGRDFLRYASDLYGFPYEEARVRRMLEAVDLEDAALSRLVRTFSKGMTQKLGLAATFLAERELYVLDEPMSGLDPKARACVKQLLAGVRAAGRAIFLTSHALVDIEEMCDRVVVLHRGVPYFAGTPRQLCQDYGQVPIEQAFLRCIEALPYGGNEHQANAPSGR